ncbi:MAG: CHAP domain-containing protein [Chitinispirillaceae bacterium]|nr:CHAP domain-containing protein [Chitinispirillaceae bacterium]
MIRLRLTTVVVVVAVSLLHAQTYQLQGTIRNQADFPVKNLTVRLAKAGHRAVTDTAGNFLVTGPVVTRTIHGTRSVSVTPPLFKNNRFFVTAGYAGTPVSAELFTVQGRRVGEAYRGTAGRGEQQIPLALEQTGASLVIAHITVGSALYRFKLMHSGASTYSCGVESAGAVSSWGRSGSLPQDTLVIFRKDTVEYRIPVTAVASRYQILLDLLPYEITEDVAIKEDRRGPEQVGAELRTQNIYPYDLWTYLTGPDDAWCSEFLCWAYRVAGYPTGTDAGTTTRPRWLLKGNTNIRSWFQNTANLHEWIDRTSPKWETFVPVYGDFVRYDNSGGGHTGIVRWVSGTSLYTVEGNVSNQVRIRTITNYKSNTSIDGFGRRSGVRQDSHTQTF